MDIPLDQMIWWCCFQQEQDGGIWSAAKKLVLLPVFSLESQVVEKDVVRAIVWDSLEGDCCLYRICLAPEGSYVLCGLSYENLLLNLL